MLKNVSSILVSVLFPIVTFAFRLDPMVMDFTPDGDRATKIFRVENDAKEKIAVKIQAFKRLVDESGAETREPTDHFKIYPEQFSLNESDSRVVRVTYTGPKELEKEAAYRLVAAQLPVSFAEVSGGSGIKFLFEFVASVYVSHDKFIPQLEVSGLKRINQQTLQVTLLNKGQRHRLLRNVKVHIKDMSGKNLTLNEATVKDWNSENMLAGAKRNFNVKSALKFDLKHPQAVVEIKDEE